MKKPMKTLQIANLRTEISNPRPSEHETGVCSYNKAYKIKGFLLRFQFLSAVRFRSVCSQPVDKESQNTFLLLFQTSMHLPKSTIWVHRIQHMTSHLISPCFILVLCCCSERCTFQSSDRKTWKEQVTHDNHVSAVTDGGHHWPARSRLNGGVNDRQMTQFNVPFRYWAIQILWL